MGVWVKTMGLGCREAECIENIFQEKQKTPKEINKEAMSFFSLSITLKEITCILLSHSDV